MADLAEPIPREILAILAVRGHLLGQSSSLQLLVFVLRYPSERRRLSDNRNRGRSGISRWAGRWGQVRSPAPVCPVFLDLVAVCLPDLRTAR